LYEVAPVTLPTRRYGPVDEVARYTFVIAVFASAAGRGVFHLTTKLFEKTLDNVRLVGFAPLVAAVMVFALDEALLPR